MPVSIVEQEGRRTVNSQHAIPSRFPARAWMLDGEWDAGRRVWYFAAGDVERVRALCREVCGTADSSEPFPAGIGDNSRPLAGPSRQPCEVGKRFLGEAVYQTWATFAWRMQNADTCGSCTGVPLLYTAKLRAAWLVGANVPNLKTVPRAGLRALLHSAIWAAPEGPRGDMGSVALISDERRGRRSPSTYLASGLRRAGISSTRQTQKSEGPRLWHRRPRGIVRSACSRKTIRNSRLGGSMVLRQRNCRHGIAG